MFLTETIVSAASISLSLETPVERINGQLYPDTSFKRGKWFNSGDAIFIASTFKDLSIPALFNPNGVHKKTRPLFSEYSLWHKRFS